MWIFVASRYVHAWVHLTSNNLRLRSRSFFLGAIVLGARLDLVRAASARSHVSICLPPVREDRRKAKRG